MITAVDILVFSNRAGLPGSNPSLEAEVSLLSTLTRLQAGYKSAQIIKSFTYEQWWGTVL